ncbi:MAG: prolipoprotein diacylglyceryl transferase [Patescibacteria group bacterium]
MLLHDWVPPATIEIAGITVSLYGLTMALGLVSAYVLMLYLARRSDRAQGTDFENHVDGLFWWSFVCGLIAARLLFVLYHPDFFISAPQEIIAIWHGGIVWHGALVGGIAGSVAYCRLKKISWFGIADLGVPAIALGQAIGRWGNYFNQENYGLPTTLPWGIPIDAMHRIAGYEGFAYFHPTFLYESKFDLMLFAVLFIILIRWVLVKKAAWYRSGMLFAAYLALYSLGRFLIEFLRIDTVPEFWGLRLPQWWSIDLIIISLVGITVLYAYRNNNTCISQKR